MKRILIYLLVMGAVASSMAQNTEPRGVNNSLQTATLSSFRLPAKTYDICFLDGKLHVSTDGMLFAVKVADGLLGFPEIDTALTSIDHQMTYAVRHPSTNLLYFTKKDAKGVSCLFEYYEKKPGKYDIRRVKPYGFSYSVEHPVFSADGRVMVFASDCPIGFGGRDLWYSELKNGEWQYPQNMGRRINTEGEESMPAMYGEFLLFSSDGRSDSYGGNDLYATRLVALEQTGDTVMMFPIGRSAVHSLEAPFCSENDDFGFVVDGSGIGWWLSRDTAGNETYHTFAGRMDCVKLTGVVSDINGLLMSGADVVATQKDRQIASVKCDGEGRFCLFLQPEQDYELTFSAPDHFVFKQQMSLVRTTDNMLYASEKYNVTLLAFDLGKPYSYDDLFNSSVSSELSAAGRKRMDLMVRFLIENPHLRLTIASAYNQSSDAPFCSLLNNSRLRALMDYIKSKGVPLSAITTSTTKPSNAGAEADDEPVMSAAAVSSKTVFFTFSR